MNLLSKRLYSTVNICFLISLLCSMTFGALVAESQPTGLYGQQIVVPADAGAELKASIQDLSSTLSKMTGHEFKVGNDTTAMQGIFLLRSDSPLAPADAVLQLKGKGREPFVIRSSDANRLLIVANRDEGLSHGLYFYLEQLGVRYYFPTDKWTIIPTRQNIAIQIDRLIAPTFKMRTFAGTGGFGGKLPVDQEMKVQRQWETWKRRNRFGGEFRLAGHSGEAFNTEKKAILLEHLEYLAKVNGQHVPWSVTAKLNVANPDAVQLYVDWSLARYRKARQANPDSPSSFAVSVDPSDGGGECNSEECKKIGNGSSSDIDFYIANQVAKAVRAEFPDGWVSLYAYNQHAAVPSIPLEPNVYVVVIPYAFQSTGLSAEELIGAWVKKVPRMSIYDYWSIPDWSWDHPTFNYLQTATSKLRYWHEHGIEGFTSESTTSAGAMGLAWYVGSRLMWDPATEVKPIVEEFYQKAFGPAAAPMKRMMERWTTSYKPISHELGMSYRDLQEALKLAQDDPAVLGRVLDYGRYLHYLRLHYEMQQAKGAERNEAVTSLMRYVMSIHGSTMITSFRIYQLVNRLNTVAKELTPGWKDAIPLSDAEVPALISDGAQRYQPLNFESRSYFGKLVPLPAALRAVTPEELGGFSPALIAQTGTTLEVEAPAGVKELPLQLSSNEEIHVVAQDSAGNRVYDQSLKPDAEGNGTVRIPLPRAGHYSIRIGVGMQTIRIQVPAAVPVVMRSWANSQGAPTPRLYFYVPRGLKNLAMYLPYIAAGPPRVLGPDGKEVAAEAKADGGKLLIYPVAPGQDGKVWSLDRAKAPKGNPLQLLNAPNVFSLFPDTLLVPEDALK